MLGSPKSSLNWIDVKEMRDAVREVQPAVEPKSLRELYDFAPESAIALLESMLEFEPSRRPAVAEVSTPHRTDPHTQPPHAGRFVSPARPILPNQAIDHDFFKDMQMRAPSTLALAPVDAATIDFEYRDVKVLVVVGGGGGYGGGGGCCFCCGCCAPDRARSRSRSDRYGPTAHPRRDPALFAPSRASPRARRGRSRSARGGARRRVAEAAARGGHS